MLKRRWCMRPTGLKEAFGGTSLGGARSTLFSSFPASADFETGSAQQIVDFSTFALIRAM